MRIEFAALEVDTIGGHENGAATFTGVEIELRIDSEASEEKIQKCLEKTIKVCPVGVLFHQAGVGTKYSIKRMVNA